MSGEEDISSLVSVFEDFFTGIYKERINNVLASYPNRRSLEVNYDDLDKFDTQVADKLVKEPEVLMEAAEEAVRNMNLTPASGGEFKPHVRFFNAPGGDKLTIERLSSERLNELVSFRGIVTKRTDVMHKVKIAHYSCQACGNEIDAAVTRSFKPPKMCPSCRKLALVPNEEKSRFTDMQKSETQDLLERVRGGAPAAKVELWFEDDIVNTVTPGDNIEITGILRIKPTQNLKQKNDFLFTRYIEVVHAKSLKRDFEEIELTREDIDRIKEMSKDPAIEKKIFSSIAPAVYGYNEVKKALALQLFGGTRDKMMKGGAMVRDDIHLLLIGDPGIAKCTDGDSEVLLADGSLVKIRDAVEGVLREKGEKLVEDGVYATSNHDILSLDLDGKVSPSKATHFWKLEAPEFMYEIETGTGKKVIVTPEHPFFISSDGYVSSKMAREISEGEFIATPRRLEIKGAPQPLRHAYKGKINATKITLPKQLDAGFSRILGYLAGDGYFRRTSSYEISLTNNDPALLDDFCAVLSSYGIETTRKKDKRTGATTAFAFSVELGKILAEMGMEKTSFEKTIPQEILRSPDSVAAEFVKAYFDCEASVGKEGITVVSASRELLSRAQLLLLRFGIISQLHETHSRATNSKSHKKTKYFRLFILGENAKKYGEGIGFTSPEKSKKLKALGDKFNTNIDVIPNLAKILKETRKMLQLTQYDCGVPRPTYAHFEQGNRNPSRATLAKIVSAFRKHGKGNKNVRLLELLSKSHIFWDRVRKVRKINPKEKWVYDLQVDPTHNFIANGMVVHNTRFLNSSVAIAPKAIYVSGKSVSGVGLTASAEKDELGDGGWTLKAGALVLASGGIGAIDEFDKIDDEDRGSLHEVMESQSYHYNTKIMFSDGREVPMGELVEDYLGKNKEKIIRGKDCLILRDGIAGINLLTTDFERISETTPAQISKHKAPDYFIKVTLQTGRELLVTPEHPFWMVDNGEIVVKEAEKLTTRDYTLMPRALPIKTKDPGFEPGFFKFIGYHITDGGYELNRGKKNGINFYNKDPALISDYHDVAESIFGTHIYSSINPATGVMAERITSMPVLNRLAGAYPPLIAGGKDKNIPPQMMSAPKEHVSHLLRAIFDGDGTFTNGHIALVSENEAFAKQVQLLLLRFGVRSRVYRDDGVWRVSFGGRDNLGKYAADIGFLSAKKMARLEENLKKRMPYRTTTDVVPNCAGKVLSLLKSLKIFEHEAAGYCLDSQKRGYSFTTRNFKAICSKMRQKLDLAKRESDQMDSYDFDGLVKLRERLNLSQQDLQNHSSVKRATISYWETRKIFKERYRVVLKAALRNILSLEKELLKLERFAFGDIGFVAIRKIEKIPNKDQKWVYDVTVEPSRAFISECSVLHNTVSIAKAGIVAKFRAKTAIIAAANPKHGRFNQTKNLADQFDVPPSLLSRFDLIFPIIDVLDEEKDLNLAEHILTSHINAAKGKMHEDSADEIDRELLRKYIAYARREIKPVLSEAAKNRIKDFYLDLRRRGKSSGSVPITPRYLEGMVRLSEAHAKMRLSDVVELADSEAAIGLMEYVLKKVMTDQETGRFDVDIITTGKARSQVERIETILDILKEKTRDQEAVPREEVLKAAEAAGMDPSLAKRILSDLIYKGDVYEKEPGWIALVGEK